MTINVAQLIYLHAYKFMKTHYSFCRAEFVCCISFLHLTFLFYWLSVVSNHTIQVLIHLCAHSYTRIHTNMLVDNPVSQHTHSKFHASFLLFSASVLNEMDFILIITSTQTYCECAANVWFDFFCANKTQWLEFLFTKKKINRVKF